MITNQPIIKLPVRDQERYDLETRQMLVREGYNSYRCGVKLDDCPPYADNDMVCSWRIGWHRGEQEDRERIERLKAQSK